MSTRFTWSYRVSARTSRALLLMLIAVTTLIPWLPAVRVHAQEGTAATTGAEAAAHVARVQRQVERAEAIRAVKRLQHAYAQYQELGLWNDMADLFADAGVMRAGTAAFNGREQVRQHLLADIGHGRVGIARGQYRGELVLEPVVTFDPDFVTIRARWHALSMHADAGAFGRWQGGIYENLYVRERGAWKIAALHYTPTFSGNYEDAGWRETPTGAAYHYTPDRAGIPIPIDDGAAVAGGESTSARVRLGDLARRVQRLNDEGDILNLQASYGYYVDRKMWDDAADLFAADATMEADRQGVYVGRSSIRHAFDQFGERIKEGELNDHLQFQPVVDVAADGRTARARGVELRMTGVNGAHGEWTQAIFENAYVKQDGVWKMAAVHVYPRMLADYDSGWKEPRPVAAANAAFPPDRPPSADVQAYPEVAYPAFHYANPATGKPTQYPADARVFPLPSSATGEAGRVALPKGNADAPLREVERQLAMATARDGAENIANAYGYYIDDFEWDDCGALFARDGWKELSYIGVYVGRDRVTQSMKMRYGRSGRTRGGGFQVHQKMQPVIHVSDDGRHARIRTRLWQIGGGPQGSWIGGIYENQAVLEDGVWKIAGMDLDYVWTAIYKGGWARVAGSESRRYAPQAAPPIAPDRPLRGPAYAPFPQTFDTAFHYRNPVSGREPALLLTDGPPIATSRYRAPRTPDGQPDLQGTWVNFDDTPFESTGPGRRPSDVNPPEHWADHDGPTSAARRAMVIDPPDGLVPLLPSAEAQRDFNISHVGDSWIYETPWVRCVTRGVPGGFFPAQYNNGYQIFQVPGYVVIRSEMVHDVRIIPIDGREHLGAAIKQWNGDSRGRWDGETLVVETTNYNDKGMIATSAASGRVRGVGQSDRMRLVERFTRVSDDRIDYQATIEDPKIYARPWTVAFPFNRDDKYEIYEYSCHEHNYSMINELTAGRALEREAAGGAAKR